MEFALDGAATIDGGGGGGDDDGATNARRGGPAAAAVPKQQQKQQRRRRRSSARFLRLSSGGEGGGDGEDLVADGGTDRGDGSGAGGGGGMMGGMDGPASTEHLGEIYRRAIQMNAENKINANNSWGFRLIENMDKFIIDDGANIADIVIGGGGGATNADGTGGISPMDELRAARKMRSKDDRGRVNFAKASCAIDASVKIYSYRVDDVHLSSFRVLANLNRSDVPNGKEDDVDGGGSGDFRGDGVDGLAGEEEGGGGGERIAKRRTTTRTTDTLETNMGE